MSCKRLLSSVGSLARARSSSNVSVWNLYTARSWMSSILLLSDDLQNFHTRWQWVNHRSYYYFLHLTLWVLLLFKFSVSLDKLSSSFANKLLCPSSLLSKCKFIPVSKFIKNSWLSSNQASWASNSSSSSISFVDSSRCTISVSNAFCKASLPLLVVAYLLSYDAVILLLSSVPPKHFFGWSSFSLEDLQPSSLLSGTCLQNKSNVFSVDQRRQKRR